MDDIIDKLVFEATQLRRRLHYTRQMIEINNYDDNDNCNNKNDALAINRSQWFESTKSEFPVIDKYFYLSPNKHFKVIKIMFNDENNTIQTIERSIPITFNGKNRSREEMEEVIANQLFFAGANAKVPRNENEDNVPEEMTCVVCQQIMIEPCTIGNDECKHVFCRVCIEKWQSMGQTQGCPMCRRPIIKIKKDRIKEKQIKSRTPLIACRQGQIDGATQGRVLRIPNKPAIIRDLIGWN